jgi:HSP20 family molecular chaperone IbpA
MIELFDRIFPDYGTLLFRPPMWNTWKYEEKSVLIETVIPGYDKEDFDISAEGNELVIKVLRDKNRYFRYYVSPGAKYDVNNADVKYKSGILKIRIPKCNVATKKIEVS